MTIWTKELRSAAIDLSSVNTLAVADRGNLLRDIAGRAAEMTRLEVGAATTPMQNDFINALRSRLGDYCIGEVPEVVAFKAAFAAAPSA